MKLRNKLILLVAALVFVMSISMLGLSKYNLMAGFSEVEDKATEQKSLQVADAIKAMEKGIVSKAADWGIWDDAYKYVQDKNSAFEESNFSAAALPNLKIDALAFYDVKGLPIKEIGHDLDNDKAEPFNADLKKYLQPGSELFVHANAEDEKHGLMMTAKGPFLFVARPVVNSDGDKPSKGTIFFARLLSPKQIKDISETTHFNVDFTMWSEAKEKPGFSSILNKLDPKKEKSTTNRIVNENTIEGYVLLHDFKSEPAAVFRVTTPRDIYLVGQSSLNTMILSIGVACLLFGIAFIFSLESTVIRRVLSMTDRISDIKKDIKTRLVVDGADEVAVLGHEMNAMLDQIEKGQNEIKSANKTISTMLNSVQQGFFVFNKLGQIENNSSQACLDLLEQNPSGQKIWDVFKVDKENTEMWLEQLFEETIAFESMVELGPNKYAHSKGRSIVINYYPVRDSAGTLTQVVALATDITAEVQAKKEAFEQKLYVEKIIKMVKNKNEFIQFINESRKVFKECHLELSKPQPNLNTILRHVHTMKGGAGAFSLQQVQEMAHTFETYLVEQKTSSQHLDKNSILKRFNDLKDLFENTLIKDRDLIGESAIDGERRVEIPYKKIKDFYEDFAQKTNDINLKSKFLDQFASEPLSKAFEFYNDVGQSLANRLGKSIQPIKMTGESIKVLHEPYSELFSSMLHALRNSIDHGIEAPEVREQSGKPLEGQIHIHFEKFNKSGSDWLRIKLSDDGQGLNLDRIKQKLISDGVSETEISKWSNEKLVDKIFEPGFSTATSLTETSGRGIGMNAIKEACLNLGGSCFIKFEPHQGSDLFVEVPLYSEFKKITTQNSDSKNSLTNKAA